jgi:hypothetical protein
MLMMAGGFLVLIVFRRILILTYLPRILEVIIYISKNYLFIFAFSTFFFVSYSYEWLNLSKELRSLYIQHLYAFFRLGLLANYTLLYILLNTYLDLGISWNLVWHAMELMF